MKGRSFSLICGLVMSMAMLPACSSSSAGSGNSACETYGKALVSYESRCAGTIDPARTNPLVMRYREQCESSLALAGVPPSTSSSLTACAAAIQGESCNTSFGQLEACNFTARGSVADGAACAESLQCASGSCSGASGATTACGTCEPAIADGAACDQGGTCVAGDVCTTSASGATCRPRPSLGGVGASCTSNDACSAPNHCALVFSGGSETGTCASPVAVGGACSEKTDCASGLICTGAATRTCSTPLPLGATCNGGDCGVGFACDATFKCIAIAFVAPGGTCDGDERFCSQGTCPLPDSGTVADPTGICPTILADGAACDPSSTSAQCDTFATCTNGKCTLVPGACN